MKRLEEHFLALKMEDGRWAITDSLAGIHSAGLIKEDFAVMDTHGASMIWSPLSNLLLYGQTARIAEAKAKGILIGLGSDWSVTGSKNLLGELKVAYLVSQELDKLFSPREIVAMATSNAAKILKWEHLLGSIEENKRADLLVIKGRSGDPYERLIKAKETNIPLVVIAGVARYGNETLMKKLSDDTQTWRVGGLKRFFNLDKDISDPPLAIPSLREAKKKLKDGLKRLPELAKKLESPTRAQAKSDQWFLLLDHSDTAEESLRPHLPFGPRGLATGEIVQAVSRAALSEIVEPLELDPLTVADDSDFLTILGKERNLPAFIKTGLKDLY